MNKVALAMENRHGVMEERFNLSVCAVCLSQFVKRRRKCSLCMCENNGFCLYDYIVDRKLKNTVNKPLTAIKVLSEGHIHYFSSSFASIIQLSYYSGNKK